MMVDRKQEVKTVNDGCVEVFQDPTPLVRTRRVRNGVRDFNSGPGLLSKILRDVEMTKDEFLKILE